MRALRLLRTYRVLHDLREEILFFRRNEEVILSVVNLGVFVFIMTALGLRAAERHQLVR